MSYEQYIHTVLPIFIQTPLISITQLAFDNSIIKWKSQYTITLKTAGIYRINLNIDWLL